MSVTVLDCTLRDGGYVNHFAFEDDVARKVIAGLANASLDYIEVGFLQNSKNDGETTIYTSPDAIDAFLPKKKHHSKIFAMIVFGKYDLEKLPPQSQTHIDGIRITFKKSEIQPALDYIQKIKEKGYLVSANPTGVDSYSDRELLDLIDRVNEINPNIFAIVDTLGVLKKDNLIRLYYLVENNLNDSISIAFHSHNNLQLSFSNAQALVETGTKRELIIDSSLSGMGRGAGNLCTELLLQYINDNVGKKYNILPILKVIDEQISKIFMKTPWGYNVPYYLAASNACHPNYASFLMDKQSISVDTINSLLQSLPDDKKATYNEKLIQELYLCYQEHQIDDQETVQNISNQIGEKKVLIIAPGKSASEYKEDVQNFINQNNPFIISINFNLEEYNPDMVFISNIKRFHEQEKSDKVVITSNIKDSKLPTLNYGSYINNSRLADNSALMLIKFLIKIGVKDVYLVGFDGFSSGKNNYYKAEMINNAKLGEFDERNSVMSKALKKFSKLVKFHFITPSLYEV